MYSKYTYPILKLFWAVQTIGWSRKTLDFSRYSKVNRINVIRYSMNSTLESLQNKTSILGALAAKALNDLEPWLG